jgi:HD superfamily phosphodiesterase
MRDRDRFEVESNKRFMAALDLVDNVIALRAALLHEIGCSVCRENGCAYCHKHNAVEPCTSKRVLRRSKP